MVRLLAALVLLPSFSAFAADGPRVRQLPESEQLDLAFEAAFAPAEIRYGTVVFSYTPSALLWLDDNLAVLVSTSTVSEDCHACGGKLGIHYLRGTDEGFAVEGAWPEMIHLGFWGKPPDWRVRQDLTHAPILQVEAGSGWQGQKCSWTTLVELQSAEPVTILKPLQTTYDNEGFAGPREEGAFVARESVQATIVPKVRDESFVVRYAGTSNFDLRYQKFLGAFQRLPSSESEPDC